MTKRKAAAPFIAQEARLWGSQFSKEFRVRRCTPGPLMGKGSEAGLCGQKLSKENPHFLSLTIDFSRDSWFWLLVLPNSHTPLPPPPRPPPVGPIPKSKVECKCLTHIEGKKEVCFWT